MSNLHRERIFKLANSLQGYSALKIANTPLEELLPFLHALEKIVNDEEIDSESATHLLDYEKTKSALQVILDFYHHLIVRWKLRKPRKFSLQPNPGPGCEAIISSRTM